ncbi:MAG: YihY/virulence factor BrkB family protein [Myxococcota bacterium]
MHLEPARLLARDPTDEERAHVESCAHCRRARGRLTDVVATLPAPVDAPAGGRGVPVWSLLVETFHEWRDDRATTQGAALAFYSLFAAGPMVLLATMVVGWIVGDAAAQERIGSEMDALLTPELARVVRVWVNRGEIRGGYVASGLGIAVATYSSLRGFAQLQSALNMMWGVRAVRGPGALHLLRRKLFAFASIASCGVLMLFSIGLTMTLHALADRATGAVGGSWFAVRAIEELSTLAVVALLLTIVYKTLPDARIRWRDVLVGAMVSAVLFVLGKHLVAAYLRTVGVASGFGAASAVVGLLLYVQYIAQVLLFGAEFTYVFARWGGQPITPGPGAARVVRATVHDDDGRW